MLKLNLKSNHKAIRNYYSTLKQYETHAIKYEGAVSSPFDTLLQTCAQQVNATLVPQYPMRPVAGNRIVIDGVVLDEYGLPFAYWEAKDTDDNLIRAVQEKRDAGYPLDNILFQNPQRAILYQNGQVALDTDITVPAHLIAALQYLFCYVPPALNNWQTATVKRTSPIGHWRNSEIITMMTPSPSGTFSTITMLSCTIRFIARNTR